MAPKRKAPGGSSAQTCPASPAKPEPELFSDCRMLFWATHLTSVMQQRVKQLGGNVHAALAPNTTHIICAPDITPLQAAAKLASWKGPWREVHTGSGETVQLPVGVAFVRLDWVARSIAMQARQPVDDYVPQGLAAVPLPQPKPTDATAAQEQPGDQQAPPKQTSRQSTAPSSQQPREQRTSGPAATAPQASSSTSTQPLSAEELAAARQDVQQGPLPPCTVARQRSEFVAVQGVRPRFTGGDTGIPWGTAGVWDEPYDDEAARETIDRLRSFWYQSQDQEREQPDVPADSQVPQPPTAALASQVNTVCSHACCAARPFCVVEALREVKKAYVEGRDKDPFKMKAIDRGVHQLSSLGKALDTDEDVDLVPDLGPKTAAKVKEILARGSSSRLEAARGDEQLQALNQFMEVWGVGSATAQRWYALGCRSLEDVRARAQELRLSEFQEASLRHFNDLLVKIPRDEVARAEAVVREAFFELAEGWSARTDVDLSYCCVTGSYKRGKPLCSDIDILACLPPSLARADLHTFLRELLCALLDRGFLLDELSPRSAGMQADPASPHATFMGLCRPPGAPVVRRIDFKLYHAAAAPFALSYFASSQSFCRALRYYANYAVPEQARRWNPSASGFKMSDRDMQPMFKAYQPGQRRRKRRRHAGSGRSSSSESEGEQGGGGAGVPPEVLGPPVPCSDETSYFRELGLAYVPPHMRFFYDFH